MKLNIIIVSNMFYPNVGGVENTVDNLCRKFISYGHNVDIVTKKYPKNLQKYENYNGVNIYRMPFSFPGISFISKIKFSVRFIQCLYMILVKLRSKKYDIINLHYVSDNSLYALIISYFKNIPLITSIHGEDIHMYSNISSLNNKLVKSVLNYSKYIISNSMFLKNATVLKYDNNLCDKIKVFGVGVNVPKDNNFDNKYKHLQPYIIGVGRFIYQKGFDNLIKSFSIFHQKYRHVKLVLVGDGPERNNLEKLCFDLSLDKAIIFTGMLNNSEIFNIIRESEYLVMSSRREAFGIVNLEAMSVKKAVLAFDIGGVSEVIKDSINGILVKDNDVNEFANAMIYLFENKDICVKYGEKGKSIVESNYTWDIVSKKYENIFNNVVSKIK